MAVFPVANELTLELDPIVGKEYDRHCETHVEWFGHDYVPWDEGRNFAMLDGVDWEPSQQTLPQHIVDAVEIMLIDKDNLAGYHRELVEHFILEGAWGNWIGRWTAEEHLHAITLRNYLMVTRNCDANANEDVRIDHVMNTGYRAGHFSQIETVVYMAFYEALRLSYSRNLAEQTEEPILKALMEKVAYDAERHELAWSNIVEHLLANHPDETIAAIGARAAELQVLGWDIKKYETKRANVAAAGISNDETLRKVVGDRIAAWGLSDRAEFAEFVNA